MNSFFPKASLFFLVLAVVVIFGDASQRGSNPCTSGPAYVCCNPAAESKGCGPLCKTYVCPARPVIPRMGGSNCTTPAWLCCTASASELKAKCDMDARPVALCGTQTCPA